jgi:hypothetical protein
MDRKTVFTKTAKGLMEAAGKTSLVGREVRNVLTLVDGKSTVGDLQLKLDLPERKLNAHIATLVREMLIREFVIAPASITPASELSEDGNSLDFAKLVPRDTTREAAQHSAEVDAIAREIIAAAQAREERQAAAPPPIHAAIPAIAAAPAPKPPEIAGPASEVDPIAAFRVRADLTLREAERRVHDDAIKARANLQAKKDQEVRQRREAEEARRMEEDRKRLDDERRRAEADRLKNMQAAERAKREADEQARKADELRQLRERDEVEKRARAERAAEEMRIQREASRRSSVVRGTPPPAPPAPAAAPANPPEPPRPATNARNNGAEEEVRRKAREEERAKAKAQAELAAQARKEARAREIAEAEARAVARAQEREREAALVASRLQNIRDGVPRDGSIGRTIVLVVALLIAGAILIVPLIPLDVQHYQRLATEKLGMPVQIGDAAYAVFPLPHLRLRNVEVGQAARVTEVKARPQLASFWSDQPVFSEVELIGVEARPALIGALLWGRMPSDTVMPARLSLRDVQLQGLTLPPLQGTVETDAAGSRVIKIMDQGANISARLTRQGEGAVFELYAKDAREVLPLDLPIEELNVRGSADARSVQASSFDARLMDGNLKGKAALTWNDGWNLSGDIDAVQVDASGISPALAGRLRGHGNFRLQAQNWQDMERSFRLNGSFEIEKGQINGLDLARSVREGVLAAGKTSFSSLRGEGSADAGKLDVRSLRMDAGLLGGQGNVLIAGKELSGRVSAEMRTAAAGPIRGNFVLSGSPDLLQIAP